MFRVRLNMPGQPYEWVLIFSDGTGQRGVREDASVKNTNVFQMYVAAEGKPFLSTFYDPGLGAPEEDKKPFGWTRKLRNLWSKATGWGITGNIVDCYAGLLEHWKPGRKVGLFGFSRGAYTVRCLGGTLSTCGIATRDAGKPITTDEQRRRIAAEAVAAYKIREEQPRKAAGKAFAAKYAAVAAVPDVIGVFDTVKALGLPGLMNVANPWKHEFHDNELSVRVPVGLHALSIDENRKEFLPILWDDVDAKGIAAGQIVEQVWFPGVHSDIGGGYDDDWKLADLTLDWMLDRLRNVAHLHIPLTVTINDNLHGRQHDERTGLGIAWLPAQRTVRGKTADLDALCKDIEKRYDHLSDYRPKSIGGHPRVKRYYA